MEVLRDPLEERIQPDEAVALVQRHAKPGRIRLQVLPHPNGVQAEQPVRIPEIVFRSMVFQQRRAVIREVPIHDHLKL